MAHNKEVDFFRSLVEVDVSGIDEDGNSCWLLGFDKTGKECIFWGKRKKEPDTKKEVPVPSFNKLERIEK